MRASFTWILTLAICAALIFSRAKAEEEPIKMSTTTSTENSGLLDVLLPAFTGETGIAVKVFPKGTGGAIRDGMDGNVDIIFVHAKDREEAFVAAGYGAYRLGVMHNDFVIVGPPDDPAGIGRTSDAVLALTRIAKKRAPFVSRGDDSGTHMKEQALWRAAGILLEADVLEIRKEDGRQGISLQRPQGLAESYFSIGQGMGKTLTYAQEKRAYTLTDRGTYLKYKLGRKGGLNLDILCEGDPRLFNPYGIIPINPKKHPHVNFRQADRLAKWLVSPRAQILIGGYKIEGEQAFFPDAGPVTK